MKFWKLTLYKLLALLRHPGTTLSTLQVGHMLHSSDGVVVLGSCFILSVTLLHVFVASLLIVAPVSSLVYVVCELRGFIVCPLFCPCALGSLPFYLFLPLHSVSFVLHKLCLLWFLHLGLELPLLAHLYSMTTKQETFLTAAMGQRWCFQWH